MSPGDTLLQEDFIRALSRAPNRLVHDPQSMHLIKSVTSNKPKKVTQRQLKRLNKLAQLGVINLYMNDTYDLSRLGKKLVVMTH
jgi:hypothetical protein